MHTSKVVFLIRLTCVLSLLAPFSIQAKDTKKTSSAPTGRFLRITIPGDNKILTLNEVEIYSGGKNVAREGKAKQSSTAHGGVAERGMDGNKNPDYNAGGQTHTDGSGSIAPWWEVDLGKSVPVEKIEVFNRRGLGDRLNGFTVTLMDVLRETVFEKKKIRGAERILIDLRKKGEVSYVTFSGKKEKPPATGSPVVEAEVPEGYRDPAPFAFQKGDVVAILGNGLADRMQHDGWTETLLQSELKGKEVSFRNMSLSGDRPNQYPRSRGFTPMGQYLQHVKVDVVFAMFGYNESFSGSEAADSYKKLLIDFVAKIRSYKPNGKDFPRIVLFSPTAFEDLKDRNLPRGKAHNKNLSAFAKATKDAAREAGVAYVDLFGPTLKLYEQQKEPLTLNGVHLNELGNKNLGEVITQALLETQTTADPSQEGLRQAVLDKNWHWHNRYRATDGNDVWGGRSGLRFVDDQSNAVVLQHELVMLDVMTSNRDKLIWASCRR